MRKIFVHMWLLLLLSCTQQAPPPPVPELHWDDIHEANYRVDSVHPKPFATQVDILSPLRLRFGQYVNPSSLSTDSIRLVPLQRGHDWRHQEELSDIRVRMSFQGSDIVLTPLHAMKHGAEYALLVDGVVDDHGSNLQGHATWFRTRINPVKEKLFYDDGVLLERQLLQYSDRVLDEVHVFDTNGTEDIADDQLRLRTRMHQSLQGRAVDISYDALGQISSYIWHSNLFTTGQAQLGFSGPGSNGQWGDNDDVIEAFVDHRFINRDMSLVREFKSLFTDRAFDGTISGMRLEQARLHVFDNKRYLLMRVVYSDLGFNQELDISATGQIYPLDDVVSYYEVMQYDELTGRRTRVDRYTPAAGAMPDFAASQGNDQLQQHNVYQYSPFGYLQNIDHRKYLGYSFTSVAREGYLYADVDGLLRQDYFMYGGAQSLKKNLKQHWVYTTDF